MVLPSIDPRNTRGVTSKLQASSKGIKYLMEGILIMEGERGKEPSELSLAERNSDSLLQIRILLSMLFHRSSRPLFVMQYSSITKRAKSQQPAEN
ncbi:hypothetical protein EVAR_16727_1 [Eumeta japonica]|uniref:Uncharacterized protein n=1 Tax=Eumeta variegata TaxID=151549 RepID=A0A4C1V529_EUMVA|nr:hypothetical protein EVAR_16727_1 [Eumeta japonica]